MHDIRLFVLAALKFVEQTLPISVVDAAKRILTYNYRIFTKVIKQSCSSRPYTATIFGRNVATTYLVELNLNQQYIDQFEYGQRVCDFVNPWDFTSYNVWKYFPRTMQHRRIYCITLLCVRNCSVKVIINYPIVKVQSPRNHNVCI